jgi:hypothetical protein
VTPKEDRLAGSPTPLILRIRSWPAKPQNLAVRDPRYLLAAPPSLQDQPKGQAEWRKDIMGRKDVMRRTGRTESAVADLPAVKVRGIAVSGIAAGGVALRALAMGALATGAAAIGALAIGAVAVGRLRVGNAAAKKLSVGRLEVDELVIGGKPIRAEDFGPVIGSA